MPLRIVYSHNKGGEAGRRWDAELRKASTDRFEFIPFNHLPYAELFYNAGDLDRAWRGRDPRLLALNHDLEALLRETRADVLLVTNSPQYHPDFLSRLPVYRVLYSTDDPDATYRRTIPFLHAYDHVLFCAPAYSSEFSMREKMQHAGMKNADWLPLGVFDFEFDPSASEDELILRDRPIDIVYVGGCFLQKLPVLARVERAFGRRFRLHGLFNWKHNGYFMVRHGARRWVTPISDEKRLRLYQSAKIGFNLHWDEYTAGNQRLYHLPANGVMQISDCPDTVGTIYQPGTELSTYRSADDLIDQIRHYLANPEERLAIARAGYRRTMREYRIADVTRRAAELIERGMNRSA